MSNIEPSVSSRVVEYLRNYDSGSKAETFTGRDIHTQCGLPKADYSAVSGILTRARKAGLIELLGVYGNQYVYGIADRDAVVRTYEVRGKGGVKGALRTKHKLVREPKLDTPAQEPTTPREIAPGVHIQVTPAQEQLLHLATVLFNAAVTLETLSAHVSLENATKEQLLAELAKRMT